MIAFISSGILILVIPTHEENAPSALMICRYPEFREELSFPEDEVNFELVMDAIKAVRARRAEMNVPPSRKAHLFIVTGHEKAFLNGRSYISKLAYSSDVTVSSDLPENSDKMVSAVTDQARLFMPMADLVDFEAERIRLSKELEKTEKLLAGQNAKLANENFVSRAPEAVVNAERDKKTRLEALISNLKLSLNSLG